MKSPLFLFIIKALGFFIIWYMIYELWLLPDGRLDEWISLNIIGVSKGLLELISYEVISYNRVVSIYGANGIEVIDGCNGIAAMGLFIGFIVSYPGLWRQKLSFIVLGLALIYIVNILRITVLVITQVEWESFFNIAHDYATTSIFYFLIFFLWMLWVNTNDFELKNG